MKNTELKEIEKYFDRLWPICRSITGQGLRDSLTILSEIVPLKIHEVPSGKKVFDWSIPPEWNIKDAYILTPDGKKLCEFKKNNLHVVNYSEPVDKEIEFDELKKHLHFLEQKSKAIPYVTSYYKRNWGFCISYDEFKKLPAGKYRVVIDSSFTKGSLSYGECILKGKSKKEILISTYVCHPSMANNELSGPLVAAFLYKRILELKNRKYTYRFLFAPETIGVIAYLHKNGAYLKKNLSAGYVLTCCGDSGQLTYKRSKRATAETDRVAEHVLKYSGKKHQVIDFSIGGSDERQYCSPGFNLPVGSLMRTPYQQYPEYHTSLDDKNFVSFSAMLETADMYFQIVKTFELNAKYKSKNPFCEPQLGKRGLYPQLGGTWGIEIENTRKMLHLLAFADGKTDLLQIADKRNLPATAFETEIDILKNKKLL